MAGSESSRRGRRLRAFTGTLVATAALLLAAAVPASATLEPVGDQVRVSRSGADGTPALRAYAPATAFDPVGRRYLIVWWGDPSTDDDFEIHGRFTDADGTPVTPEFRISTTFPGDAGRNSHSPAVVYNSRDKEFLVVWHGEIGGVDDDNEVWGQRVSTRGDLLGPVTRLSSMGHGDPTFDGHDPRVAYNAARNEYFVVFWGQDDALGAAEGYEVFGRRVTADLQPIGAGDFRVSAMGPDGQTFADAVHPSVVWNSRDDEYLVAWRGDDFGGDGSNTGEVWVRRYDGAAAQLGAQKRVSAMGGGDPDSFNMDRPNVAYNAIDNQYMLVWKGDHGNPTADDQFEVYGQRLAASAAEIGSDDFRISHSGKDNQTTYRVSAAEVGVIWMPASDRFLVAWTGDADRPPFVDEEYEVFGQELAADGSEVGTDFPISSAGPDSSTAFAAYMGRSMAYDPERDHVAVVWDGDDDLNGSRDGDFEAFLRRVAPPPAPPVAQPTPSPQPPVIPPAAAKVVRPFKVSAFVLNGRRRITSLRVSGLARGSRVSVLCRSGCSGRRNRLVRKRVRARKRGSMKVTIPARARMRLRARVEVRVSLRGHVARYAQYRLTITGARRGRQGCLGSRSRRIACP